MKKQIVLTLVVALIFLALLAIRPGSARGEDLPPALPSSFWGYVDGGHVEQPVVAVVNSKVAARTTIFDWGGEAVYRIDVPMDGIADGTRVTFKVGGNAAGSAKLHSGSNQRLDLVYEDVERKAEYSEPEPAYPLPEPGQEHCDWVWYLLGFCEP